MHISVIDNGIGIAEDNLPRIFGMFAQAAVPPDRAPEGLGIGLSLVSRLLEMHGGQLRAESPGIGMGSTFTVELPVLRTSGAECAAGGAAEESSAAAGLRVLLVDDNVDAMEMMGFLLAEMGHETWTTSDASQIEELALRHRPQVIVLDIGLPGADGYQLARMIKSQSASWPTSAWWRIPATARPKTGAARRKRGSMRTWSSRRSWTTSRRRCAGNRTMCRETPTGRR